ncbi:MAG: deoxyribodipyrimidine photo-lyase [Pseudomonadales bacterium]|nr:deoxyribodipyrimidine photo-lyase [Pseudomonadales bacterium]
MSHSNEEPCIVWFRQDLRLQDNPALHAAVNSGRIIPVYILDDINSRPWQIGAASRWWLHHSLQALNRSLNDQLLVLQGDALTLLPELAATLKAKAVYWNRCYEPWRIQRDRLLKERLTQQGVACHSSNASLLWEPWHIAKQDGTPYQVFTAYYRRGCLQAPPPGQPLVAPAQLPFYSLPADTNALPGSALQGSPGIDALRLLPSIPWDTEMRQTWQIGEQAAQASLNEFLCNGLDSYRLGRNFPAQARVSRLSPYLHFGEISPRQVWHAALGESSIRGLEQDLDCFLSELGWREFSYYLLYHKPDLPSVNIQRKFNHFPWRDHSPDLQAWQQGQTGFPLVDAGMRELWQTGYMHNRVRMVAASFLVKNLHLPWQQGARWFWDCLVDADLASNSASWQWVAGCGADAAPYFRIFNPLTQSEKFDSTGSYIRRFVPELAALPDNYLHKPLQAPAAVLHQAGIRPGQDYPYPIVDLQQSRAQALTAFRKLREPAGQALT